MYNVIEDRTIYYIARISDKAARLLTRELRERGHQGLAPSHGDIMVALFKHRRLSMKELARIIDRDKSTVTGLVDKLVRLGYLEKSGRPVGSAGAGSYRFTGKGAETDTGFYKPSALSFRKPSAADLPATSGMSWPGC